MIDANTTDAETIDAFFELYADAIRNKDVDALSELYSDDVRVFDAWAVWCHDGIRAWRQAIDGWFSGLGPENVRVAFDDVRTFAHGDVLHASAIVTYSAIAVSGETLRALQNRLTWVLRRRPSPRIVHEHTSAPIRVDDMKALLRRTPES